MTSTVAEALLFTMPIPAVAGMVFYLGWRRRRVTAKQKSVQPVGHDLASQIAEQLQGGLIIAFRHKEYCGVGLRFAEGRYVYGNVIDGDLPTPTEFVMWGWRSPERQEFSSRESFVSWLAAQTTLSLGGEGNQRLTRERLIKAAKFCSQQPKERWASYAG